MTSNENDKKKIISRIGIGAKGLLYLLVGGLTSWAAFGSGGEKTGSEGAMKFILRQPFGQILLCILVAGLACYVFWRMYQAFGDPEDKGEDGSGIARRIGYFSSGAFYALIIFTAISMLIGQSPSSGGGGGGGGGNESIVQKLLAQEFGRWLVAGFSLIFLGKAIWQLYRAYSGKFKDKVKETQLQENERKAVVTSGVAGYTARGIVVGVIAYLTIKAALNYNASKAGGTDKAFSFVQDEFGTLVLGIIAIGLACYGVFMLVKARYREMTF